MSRFVHAWNMCDLSDVQVAAWMSWIPLVFGSAGAIGGGILSDKYTRNKGVRGRLLVLITCCVSYTSSSTSYFSVIWFLGYSHSLLHSKFQTDVEFMKQSNWCGIYEKGIHLHFKAQSKLHCFLIENHSFWWFFLLRSKTIKETLKFDSLAKFSSVSLELHSRIVQYVRHCFGPVLLPYVI